MENQDQFNYPFEWLDEIVGTSLNPEHLQPQETTIEEIDSWQQQLRSETSMIWKNLKAKTFLLLSRKKIETMLSQYHESLDELKRQAMVNMAAYPEEDPLNSFCGQVLSELEKLQIQFRRRYAPYLNNRPDDSRQQPITPPLVSGNRSLKSPAASVSTRLPLY